jgi:hypothetical protein
VVAPAIPGNHDSVDHRPPWRPPRAVMSITAQYAPTRSAVRTGQPPPDFADARSHGLRPMHRIAPLILHRQVITPVDLSRHTV